MVGKFKNLLILFLISPALSFGYAMNSLSDRKTYIILILFFGYFGLTMNFPEGTDGFRHTEDLNYYAQLSINQWINELIDIFKFIPPNETLVVDPYLHTISYIASFFSTSSHLLYLIVGLVYGFFFVSSLRLIHTTYRIDSTKLYFILFLCFFFWKSFEGLNSIRNWTGAWCMFYGIYSNILKEKKSYLLYVAFAPLIHFGYGLICLPFVLVKLLGNRPILYMTIYILSFLTQVSINNFSTLAQSSKLSKERYSLYYQEEDETQQKRADFEKNASFHKLYAIDSAKWTFLVWFFVALTQFKYFARQQQYFQIKTFASIALLMLSFANWTYLIPSLSKRLELNAIIYVLAYIVLTYKYWKNEFPFKKKQLRFFSAVVYISAPILALFIFMQLSYIIEFADIKIFLSPLLSIFMLNIDLPIKEILKDII